MTRTGMITLALIAALLAGCSMDAGWSAAGNVPSWELTMMAYTYRDGTFFEAIEKTQATGLDTMEGFSWQPIGGNFEKDVRLNQDAPPEAIEQVKARLDAAGIKLVNMYDNQVGKDEPTTRKFFAFCEKLGIKRIIAEPEPDTLDLVEKMADEYGIDVAIHNHAADPQKRPDYVYWDPSKVMKLIEDRSRRIGTCADTGHWVRTGIDPAEALKLYGDRLMSVHMKDIAEIRRDAHDVPWGTGVGNVKRQLAQLHRQGFGGTIVIEYEHNVGQNDDEIEQCIAFYNEVATSLGHRPAR